MEGTGIRNMWRPVRELVRELSTCEERPWRSQRQFLLDWQVWYSILWPGTSLNEANIEAFFRDLEERRHVQMRVDCFGIREVRTSPLYDCTVLHRIQEVMFGLRPSR